VTDVTTLPTVDRRGPGRWGQGVALIRRMPLHLVLILIAVIWVTPSLGVVVTSFRPRTDVASTGWWTVLSSPGLTTDNYANVVNSLGFGRALLNSFLITVPATVLPIAIASFAAFAFAFLSFPGRRTLFLIVIALMVMPTQAAFVPILQLFTIIGLNRTYVGIWLAHTAFGLPFAIFLLRGFFLQLPREILESARIDGASSLRVYWKIVLPLSRPALASLAVFQFLWVWNDLLMSLVFISNPTLQPLPVQTASLLSSYGQEFDILSTSSVLLMIVPLIVFIALQRYFVRGIVAGAVK
jgi:alpha-glucoside transport system permease protein